jgi:hypothetical protein
MLMAILAEAGVTPAFALSRPDGGRATRVEAYLWNDGDKTILALLREPGGAPETFTLRLHEPARIHDLRRQRDLGTLKAVELTLDPAAPTLLGIEAPKR